MKPLILLFLAFNLISINYGTLLCKDERISPLDLRSLFLRLINLFNPPHQNGEYANDLYMYLKKLNNIEMNVHTRNYDTKRVKPIFENFIKCNRQLGYFFENLDMPQLLVIDHVVQTRDIKEKYFKGVKYEANLMTQFDKYLENRNDDMDAFLRKEMTQPKLPFEYKNLKIKYENTEPSDTYENQNTYTTQLSVNMGLIESTQSTPSTMGTSTMGTFQKIMNTIQDTASTIQSTSPLPSTLQSTIKNFETTKNINPDVTSTLSSIVATNITSAFTSAIPTFIPTSTMNEVFQATTEIPKKIVNETISLLNDTLLSNLTTVTSVLVENFKNDTLKIEDYDFKNDTNDDDENDILFDQSSFEEFFDNDIFNSVIYKLALPILTIIAVIIMIVMKCRKKNKRYNDVENKTTYELKDLLQNHAKITNRDSIILN